MYQEKNFGVRKPCLRLCSPRPKSNHTRLAHSRVTLSPSTLLRINSARVSKARFFAALRMTVVSGYRVKCANVLWSDLAPARHEGEEYEEELS
jgi:hypothetical protein